MGTTPPPPWMELPGDVTAKILRRLGTEEILKSAEKVCTTWRKVCLDPAMWRVFRSGCLSQSLSDRKFDLICRCAVERSQGQLIYLSITYFGGDELLNYVAQQSSHLRSLTLTHTWEISASGLTEAVKKLPRLEELHLLTATLKLGAEGVETIGSSCPLLKSFTHTEHGNAYGIGLAIAKTMPSLHCLKLDGQQLVDNEGLEAILDGCPRLESLDVFNCRGLDLKAGAHGERCSKQIKDLRLPNQQFFDFLDMVQRIQTFPIQISDVLLDALNSIDSDGEYDYEL